MGKDLGGERMGHGFTRTRPTPGVPGQMLEHPPRPSLMASTAGGKRQRPAVSARGPKASRIGGEEVRGFSRKGGQPGATDSKEGWPAAASLTPAASASTVPPRPAPSPPRRAPP